MSARDEYPAGVPCWVENLLPEPAAILDFYRSLFGWNFRTVPRIQESRTGSYYIAQLNGRDVAGVGLGPSPDCGGSQGGAQWITHIRVGSADKAAWMAEEAGGRVLVDPFDIVPAGRMALVADPAGACFAVWEPQTRRGAQLVNEAGAWALSTLITSNPEQAAEFYGSLFGWRSEPLGSSSMRLFRLAGYVGGVPTQPVPRDVVALMQGVSAADGIAHWDVDFWIDDVDRAASTAATNGGDVRATPRDTGLFRFAALADNQGATFTVSKRLTILQ